MVSQVVGKTVDPRKRCAWPIRCYKSLGSGHWRIPLLAGMAQRIDTFNLRRYNDVIRCRCKPPILCRTLDSCASTPQGEQYARRLRPLGPGRRAKPPRMGYINFMAEREGRPSPEALLAAAKQEGRGRLKIFLGAAPGVGKTYEMLQAAQAGVARGSMSSSASSSLMAGARPRPSSKASKSSRGSRSSTRAISWPKWISTRS